MNGKHACPMLSLPRPHFYESRLFSLSQEFPGGPGRRTSAQLQPPRGPRAPSPTVQRRPRWISSFSIGSHRGWTRLSHRPGPSVSAAPWGRPRGGPRGHCGFPRETPRTWGIGPRTRRSSQRPQRVPLAGDRHSIRSSETTPPTPSDRTQGAKGRTCGPFCSRRSC